METFKKCVFCETECKIFSIPNYHLWSQYRCKCCGDYSLFNGIASYGDAITERNSRFKISCVLNERRLRKLGRVVLSFQDSSNNKEVDGIPILSINEVLNEFPNKASDFIVRTLLNLSRMVEHPFERIKFNTEPTGKYTLFSQSGEQADSFLRQIEKQGWISSCNSSNSVEYWMFSLTGKCWEMIENLQRQEINSKRVFVAMWFDLSMSDYYEKGIKPAIEKAGYDPVRIDSKEFNGKICDEIIAEIKRCKFLVSDFSGQRGGVYFEAGFAMGQGKPVIFSVKESDIKELHFDTRQYNHIVYNSPEDLCKKLYNRICATIV